MLPYYGLSYRINSHLLLILLIYEVLEILTASCISSHHHIFTVYTYILEITNARKLATLIGRIESIYMFQSKTHCTEILWSLFHIASHTWQMCQENCPNNESYLVILPQWQLYAMIYRPNSKNNRIFIEWEDILGKLNDINAFVIETYKVMGIIHGYGFIKCNFKLDWHERSNISL